MVRFPKFVAAWLLFVLSASLVTVACKPRQPGSEVLANESGSSVSVDQEFLDTASKDAETSARKAGYLRAMSDSEMDEKRRSLARDIATLSVVATDLVIWFDEVKDKSKAGKIPEISKSVEGGEFNKVHQGLAIAQQQLKPMLNAAYWEDLTKAPTSDAFKSRYAEIRESLRFFEGGMRTCADAIRRWNASTSGWVSKSYSRVKEYKRRMVQQESEGKFPSEAEVKAAYEKDMTAQAAHGPQLLQDIMSSRKGLSRAYRGMNVMNLLATVPEIAGLFREPSGVSECYTVWEHTQRVISIWFDQLDAFGYPKNAKLPAHLMAVTVALHDIGKPVDVHRKAEGALRPYECGVQYGSRYDSTGQHVHNAEIVRGFLKGMGVTDQQYEIGYQLHGSDVLGELTKGDIQSQEAMSIVLDAAKATGISPQEFMAMLHPFYLADSSSYPGIYNRYISFSNQGWGGQGPMMLASNNGKLEQFAAQVQAWRPAPPPKPAVEAKPEPDAPQQNFEPAAQTGMTSIDEYLGKAPAAPVPVAPETAVQAVTTQVPEKRPPQTVSAIVPPQVTQPAAPQQATPQGLAAVREAPKSEVKKTPATQEPTGPIKGIKKEFYTTDDFCCNKVFATDDGKRTFKVMTKGSGVLYIGEAQGASIWMDGPTTLCLKVSRGTQSCFEVLSTEVLRGVSSGAIYKYTGSGRSY